MAGLTDKAGGIEPVGEGRIEQSRQAWQQSMLRRLDELRQQIQKRSLQEIALRTGANFEEGRLRLPYWGQAIIILWKSLDCFFEEGDKPCSIFDVAMLTYYLHTADGAPMADRWIAFRELPSGGFYHQAFQGYSGDLIARTFGEAPSKFELAAQAVGGVRLPALAPHAYAFQPLPRIRLASAIWLGDEDFPSRASVLFDASAEHYMTTDGLALLGAGLARRLTRTA